MSAAIGLLALLAGPLVDGHVHKAAHAGVIVHAGPYHLEVVVKDRVTEVWLLDQRERVVRPPEGSSVTLVVTVPQTGPVGSEPRALAGLAKHDHFELSLALGSVITTGFTGRISLRLGSKTHEARLRWTPLDAKHRLDDSFGRREQLRGKRRPPK
jgi:hypothetical protein